MKLYTKTGDDGTTGLFGNKRVGKDDLRLEAYGAVDELNAALGVIVAFLPGDAQSAREWLDAIQSDLFTLGAILATPPDHAGAKTAFPSSRTGDLEVLIDQMDKELKPLQNFILPRGTPCASVAHLARSIGRRAERRIVALHTQEPVQLAILAYVNRLSDFLFMLARWINLREGGSETVWTNPEGTEAGPKPDKLNATLQKLEEDKRRRQSLFEKTASDLQKKKADAAKSFQKNVDQIKREGGKVDPQVRPIDLD